MIMNKLRKKQRLIEESIQKFGVIKCYYCDRSLHAKHVTIDHILPRSYGGSWDQTNLVIACETCNKIKGNKLLPDFMPSKCVTKTEIRELQIGLLYVVTIDFHTGKVLKINGPYNTMGDNK